MARFSSSGLIGCWSEKHELTRGMGCGPRLAHRKQIQCLACIGSTLSQGTEAGRAEIRFIGKCSDRWNRLGRR
ncbi:hypothetical protein V6N11_036545 [Hibiscus sabdariffa]|uniref:Uncharacterized protein n=1 Tax=Hibiscus sabdariffa TaxID=183260 RepID=A0ABR2RBI2_9ROSI